jgi:hypothetical protein
MHNCVSHIWISTVTVRGYLCKMQYVYILTYCSKPTTSITFLQSNHFAEHFTTNYCNLPISQLYKDTELMFLQLLTPILIC